MATLTSILTSTPGQPPTYNVGMAETFSWVPVEGAGRPLYARATYLANPEDIKISLSAGDISINLDEIELNTDEIEGLVKNTNETLSAFKFENNVNLARTNTLLDLLTGTQDNSVSLLNALTANTDEIEGLISENNSLLNGLTAIQVDKQNQVITLLHQLTANTDELEFNTDGLETLLDSLTALTEFEFNETQTLLNSLTALQEDKQNQVITLLHQLTANTDDLEVNTDGIETLLDSLTALTQNEFNETQTLLDSLTSIQVDKQDQLITLLHQLTANTDDLEVNTDGLETLLNSLTALTQSEFNETQTLLDSLTALQESKQNNIITLLNQLTANTDNLEINTDEVEFLLSSTNVFLNALTAVDYATATKQDAIITLLDTLTAQEATISLDVSAINLNTDEIEGLIQASNTLLNALTAKQTITDITGIETRLDVLTAVDYATATNQAETNSLLSGLTAIQVDKQDQIITLLDQLTANTDPTGSETFLDSLTSVIQGGFDETNALLDSLTAIQVDKQDQIITLLDALTAKQTTVNLDVSAINLNTDEIEGLIQTSNTLLDALTAKQTVTDVTGLETRLDLLTAVDYSTATKQDNIITLLDALTAKQTTVNLDVSAINLNTDEIEGLIKTSNTLLDALTAKQTLTDVTGIETRLDVLTAVNYATSAKQDESNSLLSGLTAIQVDKQDQIITLLHSITGTAIEVELTADQIDLHVDDVETLLHDLTATNIQVPGFSIPPYDEISLDYYGTTNNLSNVIYKNNTTSVLSLSFVYIPNPPTSNDALLASVKKI